MDSYTLLELANPFSDRLSFESCISKWRAKDSLQLGKQDGHFLVLEIELVSVGIVPQDQGLIVVWAMMKYSTVLDSLHQGRNHALQTLLQPRSLFLVLSSSL